MATNTVYNPPPTYAEPILQAGENHWTFNPIWLKWFVDLANQLNGFASGSTVVFTQNSALSMASGAATPVYTFASGPSAMYLVAVTAEGATSIADYSAFAIVMTADSTAGATWVNNGAKQVITLSGMDLIVTQTSGAPLVVHTAITKIG